MKHSQNGRTPAETVDWEAAYDDLVPRVYGFFCYRVGDTTVAEDLTATTFEHAWRGRAKFSRDLGAFTSWLFGIARRVLTDHIRGLRDQVSLDAIPHLANDDCSTEEAVQRAMEFARLSMLLDRLGARERELMALKYGGALTNRTISKITGLSESNVGTILHRTVQWLKAEWNNDYER